MWSEQEERKSGRLMAPPGGKDAPSAPGSSDLVPQDSLEGVLFPWGCLGTLGERYLSVKSAKILYL